MDEHEMVFQMNEFYANMNGDKMTPRLPSAGICVTWVDLVLPDNWQFRFTNAR